MDDYIIWIIPPLVGAVIGYITNWLAIKMLFRPHRAHYLGKIRLPFTPGVIPGRRDDLATKIGETVSLHLLNEDELHRVLQEPRVHAQLVSHLKEGWQTFSQEERTLAALLEERLGSSFHETIDTVSSLLASGILQQLQNPAIRDYILAGVNTLVTRLITHPITHEQTSWVRRAIMAELRALGSSPGMRRHLEQQLTTGAALLEENLSSSERTVRQAIGTAGEEALEQLLELLQPHLEEAIITLIQQEDLQTELASEVYKWLNQNAWWSLVGTFLGRERISALVVWLIQAAVSMLTQPQSRQAIRGAIQGWLQERLDDTLASWLNQLAAGKLQELIIYWGNKLLALLDEEPLWLKLEDQLETLATSLEGESLYSLADRGGRQTDINQFTQLVTLTLDNLLVSPQVAEQLTHQVRHLLTLAANQPIRHTLGVVQMPPAIYQAVATVLLDVGAEQAAALLETLDISLMVRRRLGEFPVAEIEKLTLEIAGRELRVITWLGALLGAIIGFTQLIPNIIPLLNR